MSQKPRFFTLSNLTTPNACQQNAGHSSARATLFLFAAVSVRPAAASETDRLTRHLQPNNTLNRWILLNSVLAPRPPRFSKSAGFTTSGAARGGPVARGEVISGVWVGVGRGGGANL